jgi:hypothetical protein
MLDLDTVYCFNDPDETFNNVVKEITVREILNTHYAHWRGRVKSIYLSNDENENKATCLDNWIVTHWAWKKE